MTTYNVPNELVQDDGFREELYNLYQKNGYALVWVGMTEYVLHDMSYERR